MWQRPGLIFPKERIPLFGLYHFAGRYYNRADQFFFERRFGGFGSISYPLSVFSSSRSEH